MSLDPDSEEYTLPSPPDLDGVTYLYGHPLLNSLSPLLHKTIYTHLSLNWAQIPLSTSSTPPPAAEPHQQHQQQQQQPYTLSPPIPTFLSCVCSSPKFKGSSVTMPHKVSILPHLDDLTDEAKGVGACNTIFLRPNQHQNENDNTSNSPPQLIGTNTDCIGIREALLRHMPTPTSTPHSSTPSGPGPALIFGGGGTARAAIYALTTYLSIKTIYIINRDKDEVRTMVAEYHARTTTATTKPRANLHHITSPTQIPSLAPPSIIISGIPNYPPRTPSEVKARESLDAFLVQPNPDPQQPRLLLEMCYHPHPWTSIAGAGDRAGWTVILGTEAMIWQGLEQARLWTGRDEITADEELLEKVNLVIAQSLKERNRQGKLA